MSSRLLLRRITVQCTSPVGTKQHQMKLLGVTRGISKQLAGIFHEMRETIQKLDCQRYVMS